MATMTQRRKEFLQEVFAVLIVLMVLIVAYLASRNTQNEIADEFRASYLVLIVGTGVIGFYIIYKLIKILRTTMKLFISLILLVTFVCGVEAQSKKFIPHSQIKRNPIHGKKALSITDTPNSLLRTQIERDTIQGDPLNSPTIVPGLFEFLTEARFFGNIDAAAEGINTGFHTVVRFDAFIRNDSYDKDFVVDIYKRDANGDFTNEVDTSIFFLDPYNGWEIKNAVQSMLINTQGTIVTISPKTSYCFCRNIQMTAGYQWKFEDNQLIVPARYGDWYPIYTNGQFLLMDGLPSGTYTFMFILDAGNLVGQRQVISAPVKWDGVKLVKAFR